jgi:hypothetical protein
MQVLCVTRPYDNPGTFTMEFNIVEADIGKLSLWLRAPEDVRCVFGRSHRALLMNSNHCALPTSLDFSHARCISLVCYSTQELRPHTNQQGESHHGFESLQPVPWTKVPPVLSFSMGDESKFLYSPDKVRLCHIL